MYGHTVFSATLTSGTTLTGQIDLGGAWQNVYLVISSMTTNTQHHIQASEATGGTFRRVYHPSLNSSTVGTNVFAIASAVSSGMVPIPNGIRFLKIETTMPVDDGATYKVICSGQ